MPVNWMARWKMLHYQPTIKLMMNLTCQFSHCIQLFWQMATTMVHNQVTWTCIFHAKKLCGKVPQFPLSAMRTLNAQVCLEKLFNSDFNCFGLFSTFDFRWRYINDLARFELFRFIIILIFINWCSEPNYEYSSINMNLFHLFKLHFISPHLQDHHYHHIWLKKTKIRKLNQMHINIHAMNLQNVMTKWAFLLGNKWWKVCWWMQNCMKRSQLQIVLISLMAKCAVKWRMKLWHAWKKFTRFKNPFGRIFWTKDLSYWSVTPTIIRICCICHQFVISSR